MAIERDSTLTPFALSKASGLSYSTIKKLWHNNFDRLEKKDVDTLLNYFKCGVADLFEAREKQA